MRYIALAAAVLAVSANATPHKRVMWDCDTHANTVRDLRADGYRLVRHKGDTDVYRLVPQIGRTGAGAEEYQIVHRRGSQDCIAIPQAE